MTDHVPYICTQKHNAPGCMFCDGGLFSCTVCHSFEGATTTDCPGQKLTSWQMDAIYAGKLDFRHGKWVNRPSGSCSSHSKIADEPETEG